MIQFKNLQVQKQVVRIFNAIAVIFFSSFLFSCVSGSYIIAGDPRPPTNPTNVKIYFDPPEKYETLGLVEAFMGHGLYKMEKTQNKVINKLKSMAAKIGSNGVLLTTAGDKVTGTSGGYYNNYSTFYNGYFGSSYTRVNEKRVAEGRAIYVIKERDTTSLMGQWIREYDGLEITIKGNVGIFTKIYSGEWLRLLKKRNKHVGIGKPKIKDITKIEKLTWKGTELVNSHFLQWYPSILTLNETRDVLTISSAIETYTLKRVKEMP